MVPPIVNLLPNPVPESLDGWAGGSLSMGAFRDGGTCIVSTAAPGGYAYFYSPLTAEDYGPGDTFTASLDIEFDGDIFGPDGVTLQEFALRIRGQDGSLISEGMVTVPCRAGRVRLEAVQTLPEGSEVGPVRIYAGTRGSTAGGTIRAGRGMIAAGDRRGVVVLPGVSAPPGWRLVDSEGLLQLRHTLSDVSAAARQWWGMLPQAYQRIDGTQNPEIGGFPLLRYLHGIGGEAQRVRDVSDGWWSGRYADPAAVPDGAPLEWLARLMGVRVSGVPSHQLRGVLTDIRDGGRSAVGTRQLIAEAARRALTGARQVAVMPSARDPHRLVILVRADELTADGLAAVAREVRAAGVVPAGHVLAPQPASPTWDQWSAAAGATWDELEQRLVTWDQADSAGVDLS